VYVGVDFSRSLVITGSPM